MEEEAEKEVVAADEGRGDMSEAEGGMIIPGGIGGASWGLLEYVVPG